MESVRARFYSGVEKYEEKRTSERSERVSFLIRFNE